MIYFILKGSADMSKDKLAEQSIEFAVLIINLIKTLKEQRESIISKQYFTIYVSKLFHIRAWRGYFIYHVREYNTFYRFVKNIFFAVRSHNLRNRCKPAVFLHELPFTVMLCADFSFHVTCIRTFSLCRRFAYFGAPCDR